MVGNWLLCVLTHKRAVEFAAYWKGGMGRGRGRGLRGGMNAPRLVTQGQWGDRDTGPLFCVTALFVSPER